MSKGSIKSFCSSVLPANFEQVGKNIRLCQRALDRSLPEGLRDMVRVQTVTGNRVSLAASSPVVANYLRLHRDSMLQLLAEVLQQPCELDVQTRPASLAKVSLPGRPARPQPLRDSTVSNLAASAGAIEDAELRAAMQSLARTLGATSKQGDD